jgi:TatA/E family protein of Tat protein translocase
MVDHLASVGNPAAWIVLFVVIAVLFSGSKIPEMMRGLGSGMRPLRMGLEEDDGREEQARPPDTQHPDKG